VLHKVDEVLAGRLTEAWPRVVQAWRKAPGVFDGAMAAALGEPEAFEYTLLHALLKRYPDCELMLFAGTRDPSPQMRAYCLIGLVELRSRYLKELPPIVTKSSEKLSLVCGSIQGETTLGDFAYELMHPVDMKQHQEELRRAEAEWAGKERTCPKCRNRFIAAKNWSQCAQCRTSFFARQVPYPRRKLVV